MVSLEPRKMEEGTHLEHLGSWLGRSTVVQHDQVDWEQE